MMHTARCHIRTTANMVIISVYIIAGIDMCGVYAAILCSGMYMFFVIAGFCADPKKTTVLMTQRERASVYGAVTIGCDTTATVITTVEIACSNVDNQDSSKKNAYKSQNKDILFHNHPFWFCLSIVFN